MPPDLHRVPRAALVHEPTRLDREPLKRLDLGGALGDWSGSYFVISAGTTPADEAARRGRKSKKERPVVPCIHGDGWIYRIDFGREVGEGGGPAQTVARASSAPVDNISRRAEQALVKGHKLAGQVSGFLDFGLTRLSVSNRHPAPTERRFGLGMRNFSNTALVPIVAAGQPLLLATFDVGRPVMVDPASLASLGPVGSFADYRPQLFADRPFPEITTTAHPAWAPPTDAEPDGSLFIANFGRDMKAIAAGPLAGRWKSRDLAWLARGLAREGRPLAFWAAEGQAPLVRARLGALAEMIGLEGLVADAGSPVVSRFQTGGVSDEDEDATSLDRVFTRRQWTSLLGRVDGTTSTVGPTSGQRQVEPERHLLDVIVYYLEEVFHGLGGTDTFFEVVVWDPESGVRKRVAVELPPGEPGVLGSVHQTAVTERYVIFSDAAFKFDFDIILPEEVPDELQLDAAQMDALRRVLTRRQPERSRLWLVPRQEILDAEDCRGNAAAPRVRARRVEGLDFEFTHFLVDYAVPDEAEAALWVIQQHATDPAEFVHTSDLAADGTRFARDPGLAQVVGMFSASYAEHGIARVIIAQDDTGALRASLETAPLPQHTGWMLGLPTAPGVLTSGASHPDRIEHLWVFSGGLLPETVTALTYGMYGERAARILDPGGPGEHAPWAAAFKKLVADGGMPGGLIRVSLPGEGQQGLQVLVYEAPRGVLITSPQCAPDNKVVAVIFRDAPSTARSEREREIWVFDVVRKDGAESIEVLARYDASALACRFTLHTAWLSGVQMVGKTPSKDLTNAVTGARASARRCDEARGLQRSSTDPSWALYHEVLKG